MIDQLVGAHYIEPYVEIPPGRCADLRPDWAQAPCGSHRVWWDNRCQKYHKMWQVAPVDRRCPFHSGSEYVDSYYKDHPEIPCPLTVGQGDPPPIDPRIQDWIPPDWPNNPYNDPEGIIRDCGGGVPYWPLVSRPPPYRGPWQCPLAGQPNLGDRYWKRGPLNFYDKCEVLAAGLFGPEFRGPLLNPFYGSMWPYLDKRGAGWSHPDPSPSPMAFELSGLAQGFSPAQHWSGTFSFNPPVRPYGCGDVLPYMPCAAQGAAVPDGEITYQSPTTSRVWNINIPVIADPSGQSCAGVNGSQSDPSISPVMTIVGFIRTYIIDDDIGFPSPPPPGRQWLNGGQFWQEGKGWRTTVVDPDPQVAWGYGGETFGYFYIDNPRGSGTFTELHTDIPSPLAKWQDFGDWRYWNNLPPWMPGFIPPDSSSESSGNTCLGYRPNQYCPPPTDPICMPEAKPPWWPPFNP